MLCVEKLPQVVSFFCAIPPRFLVLAVFCLGLAVMQSKITVKPKKRPPQKQGKLTEKRPLWLEVARQKRTIFWMMTSIWSNYSDRKHDRFPPNGDVVREIILFSGKPRLVKYYNLARIFLFLYPAGVMSHAIHFWEESKVSPQKSIFF